jgi:two-component system cell cycle sensor histidine kinase/response regulator CckA
VSQENQASTRTGPIEAKPWGPRARIGIFLAIHIAYALGYVAVANSPASSLGNMLIILPPSVMALMFGVKLGISSYVLCTAMMTGFNFLFGTTHLLLENTAIFGSLALLAITVTLGYLRDVSNALNHEVVTHIRTQRLLQRSEEKYRSVVERASDGIVVIADKLIVFANPRMAEILGCSLIELVGREFLEFVEPRRKERIGQLLASLHGTPPAEGFEAVVLNRKDGSPVPIELGIGTLAIGEEDAVLGIVRDVSVRHKMAEEKAALEEQLSRSQKLESLGRLAGGVAHDINNILSNIMNSATILSDDISDDKKTELANITAAAKRGGALTKDLLGFARRGKYSKRVISINDVIHKTLSLLVKTVPKNIEIVSKLNLGVACIDADPDQLSHALMNVLLNSVDALTGKRGQIRVRTEAVEVTAPAKSYEDGAPIQGKFALVEITDDGCGMSEAVLLQAFEPFFTTKRDGGGAGLGLSMVYGTVAHHGGTLEISSKENEGTTVKMMFPIVEGAEPTAEVYLGSIPPEPEAFLDEATLIELRRTAQKGCVLVVDDEEPLRKSTKRFLVSQGYDVLLANTGKDAIEIFERERHRINVILMDMIMPEMDGYDTFYELKKRSLDAEVILTSGFYADSKVEQLVKDGAFGFLQKPVNLHVLSYELYRARQLHLSKPTDNTVN